MSTLITRTYGQEMCRAIKAELSKLCSLPITWFTLGGTFIVNLILAYAFSNAGLQGLTSMQSTLEIGLASVSYAQAGLMIFGILTVCSEYNGGQIRTTLTAMPRRGIQIFAALFALTVVLIPAAFVVSSSGVLLTQILLGDAGAPIVWANLVSAMLGVSAYLTLTGLISAAIGVVLRRMLPALAIMLGYYFIAGPLIRDQADFAKYLPDTAGVVMWFPQPDHARALTPVQGGILLGAWALAAIIIAATVYRKRDV
ncbi:ABC transporter permease [Paenibacillus sp. GCM10027626]|uniref:ABC transporter permease n=1 Tax=Paenibacillus sp. GCM10027626 TaxID=3273411 RepID=UPI003629AA95